jgi:uncharacterized protein YegP (UPF0339 family)
VKLARYEVYEDVIGAWRWRLRSANSQIVASGEGYTRKQGALAGVQAHRRAAITPRVDVLSVKNPNQ